MYRSAQIWICHTLCLALVIFPFVAHGNFTSAGIKTFLDWCPTDCFCLSKTQINCHSGGLTDIPTDLPNNLQELSLSKHVFHTIRKEAFSHLRSLKKLTLDGNNISIIKPFAFRGLQKLQSLSIQYTPLNHIGEFSFAALQNVSTIILAYNKIAYIRGKAFAGSSEIAFIVLSNNPLKVIHSRAFAGLTYVDHLLLPGNIQRIDPDAFNGLEYVRFLKLDFMDLPELQPYTFRGLKHVRTLLIQTSDLGVIRKDSFFGLENVESLNIISNKIDGIEEFHLNSNFSINTLRFNKNHVLKAPRYGDAVFHVNKIEAEENHFPCDCQIHLVLDSDFVSDSVDAFRSKNFCIATAEFSGKNMTYGKNMSLVDLDSVANCHDRLRKDNYGSGSNVDSGCLSFIILGLLYLERLRYL